MIITILEFSHHNSTKSYTKSESRSSWRQRECRVDKSPHIQFWTRSFRKFDDWQLNRAHKQKIYCPIQKLPKRILNPRATISAVGGAAAFRRLSAEGGHGKGGPVGQIFDYATTSTTKPTTKPPSLEISGMEPLSIQKNDEYENFFLIWRDGNFWHMTELSAIFSEFRILAPKRLLKGKWSMYKRCGIVLLMLRVRNIWRTAEISFILVKFYFWAPNRLLQAK